MTHTFPTRRSSDLPAGPCRQPGFHRIGLLVSGDADARKVDGRLDHGSRQAVAAPHHAAAQGCGDQAGQGGRAVAVNGQRNREARRPSGLTRAPPITDEEITMRMRSEEHTSEIQSLMRISYAVFCLKQKIHHSFITTSTINYRTNYLTQSI